MILFASEFRLERDMLVPMSRGLPSVLGFRQNARISMLREPTIGSVIPDLLIAVWNSGNGFPARRPLSRLQAEILARLHSFGEGRVVTLAEALNARVSTVAPAVKELVRCGLLHGDASGVVTCAHHMAVSDVELIAIEAKLTRWREALTQAAAYREFANRTFVVLDGNRVRSNSIDLDAFSKAGIGLILQYGAVLVENVPAQAVESMSAGRYAAVAKLSNVRVSPSLDPIP